MVCRQRLTKDILLEETCDGFLYSTFYNSLYTHREVLSFFNTTGGEEKLTPTGVRGRPVRKWNYSYTSKMTGPSVVRGGAYTLASLSTQGKGATWEVDGTKHLTKEPKRSKVRGVRRGRPAPRFPRKGKTMTGFYSDFAPVQPPRVAGRGRASSVPDDVAEQLVSVLANHFGQWIGTGVSYEDEKTARTGVAKLRNAVCYYLQPNERCATRVWEAEGVFFAGLRMMERKEKPNAADAADETAAA